MAKHRTGRPPGKPPRPKTDLIPTPGQKGLVRARSAATAEAKRVFLKALAEGGSIAGACRACDRASRTVHEWRDLDPDFATGWEDALTQAVATLEAEAWRRGVEGVEEPVVSAGKIVTTVRRYSDALLKQLLAAHAPEKYARPGAQVAIAANGPVEFLLFDRSGLPMHDAAKAAAARIGNNPGFTLAVFGDGSADDQDRVIDGSAEG